MCVITVLNCTKAVIFSEIDLGLIIILYMVHIYFKCHIYHYRVLHWMSSTYFTANYSSCKSGCKLVSW